MSTKVVYLLGAGASHACVKQKGSSRGILMADIRDAINEQIGAWAEKRYRSEPSVRLLINEVIEKDHDIEQVISFLEDTPSALHKRFAQDLRRAFEKSLRQSLRAIEKSIPTASELYAALIDMHDVEGMEEELGGVLTLNYDLLLETAIERLLKRDIDFGFEVEKRGAPVRPIKVLKLHGSFGWQHRSPVLRRAGHRPLWIPPGLEKEKGTYPFNILWGRARELLECDVLRIVGCRLSANDWDLVSVLFTTRYGRSRALPYEIEVIDQPERGEEIRADFPYLGVRTLLELESIGGQVVSELIGGAPRPMEDLSSVEQEEVRRQAKNRIKNPFYYWLKQKAELAYQELPSITTDAGFFERLLED